MSSRAENLKKIVKLNHVRLVLTISEFIMKLIEDPDPKAKELVESLLEYFETEKKNCNPSCPICLMQSRFAQALRIPTTALNEVLAELKNEPFCHHSYFKTGGNKNPDESGFNIEAILNCD